MLQVCTVEPTMRTLSALGKLAPVENPSPLRGDVSQRSIVVEGRLPSDCDSKSTKGHSAGARAARIRIQGLRRGPVQTVTPCQQRKIVGHKHFPRRLQTEGKRNPTRFLGSL